MRFITFGFGIAALLATTVASAAPSKGDTGGKGGTGPEGSAAAGASGSAESPGARDTSSTQFGGKSTQNPDTTNANKPEEKPWEVAGTFESHRLIRQEDLGGAGAVKVFNVLFASAKYDLTRYDRVFVSGGAYQYFLADNGESGFRGTDISLGYTRSVPLPEKLNLRLTAASTIPVSFDSQLASNITSPSLSAALSRRFGDLAIEARIVGGAFIDRYTTASNVGADSSIAGGQPNPKWRAGGSLTAEYSMPFHRPLSAGLAITDSYIWFYEVGQAPQGSGFNGAVQDPQFGSQPMQQSYGGEVFVRYVMPDLGGMKSDITVALANGDPSLGYPSVLHDGVVHPYLLYRDTAEVYAALSARY